MQKGIKRNMIEFNQRPLTERRHEHEKLTMSAKKKPIRDCAKISR